MRVAHMRHHAHPMAADDLEGIAATVGWRRALTMAPCWALAVRLQASRLGGRSSRRRQLLEHLASGVIALLLVVVGG
jgi:fatty acid desaturase